MLFCQKGNKVYFYSMAIHLIIKGRVQGVYYRASAKEAADKLGITGWVKNTPDGNVEILAQGSDEAIDKFIDWCKQGPEHAIVKEVVISKAPDGAFEGFEIVR